MHGDTIGMHWHIYTDRRLLLQEKSWLDYLQQPPYLTPYLTPYFKPHSANSTFTGKTVRMHGVAGVGLTTF